MPKVTIKSLLDVSLPPGNEIPMSVLVAALKAIIDDYYLELGSNPSFTTTLETKLNGIEAGAQVNPTSHEITFINGLQAALDALTSSVGDRALTVDIEQDFLDLIDSAPATLNTLGKIANALGNDPNAINTLLTSIEQKPDYSIPFGKFTIYKHPDNTGGINLIEIGDKITGWWDATKFIILATFIGTDSLDINNYTIHDEIQY